MILALKTDQPEALVALLDVEGRVIRDKRWQAGRSLADELNAAIGKLTDGSQLTGIVVFKGPGSFTGLRIGLSVANAIAYALGVPIVSSTGEQWLAAGIGRIKGGSNERITVPLYGKDANITPPKK